MVDWNQKGRPGSLIDGSKWMTMYSIGFWLSKNNPPGLKTNVCIYIYYLHVNKC